MAVRKASDRRWLDIRIASARRGDDSRPRIESSLRLDAVHVMLLQQRLRAPRSPRACTLGARSPKSSAPDSMTRLRRRYTLQVLGMTHKEFTKKHGMCISRLDSETRVV